MRDIMTFPATFEEFAEQYKIVDKHEVYTNGTELIPIFRVKQWLDNADVVTKSEVASEIFEELEQHLTTGGGLGIISVRVLNELKKKYTEGKK